METERDSYKSTVTKAERAQGGLYKLDSGTGVRPAPENSI